MVRGIHWIGVLVLGMGGCSRKEEPQLSPDVPASAMAAPVVDSVPKPPPKPEMRRLCKFAGAEGVTRYPLFPTEDGVSSGVEAFIATAGKPLETLAFLKNSGAVLIEVNTRCAFDDVGLFGPTKVRIAEGPHVGRVGWVPTGWVNVEEPVNQPEKTVGGISLTELESTIAEQISLYESMKLADAKAHAKLCKQAGRVVIFAHMVDPKSERFATWRAMEKDHCKKAGLAPVPD